MTKLMIVDDQKSISSAIELLAKQNGYDFCSADNGVDALSVFEKEKPDVLILDILLPQMNGYDVCRSIREKGHDVPIIFLSAKGDIVDKSTGFKAGGDDYIVKPFSSVELMLRVEAILRRSTKKTNQGESESIIALGEIKILLDRYEVFVEGKPAGLTSKEFELLAFLASHPGKVFTREQLLNLIWDEEFDGYANSITVLVRKIREKIETDPSKPEYLLTVWRVGYKFSAD